MAARVIAVVGAAWYGEPLDPLVLVGAAIILVANLLNLRAQMPRLPGNPRVTKL